MWVICVPACGNGSKSLDVFLIGARVEDKIIANSLEKCEIRISLHGLFVDVIVLYFFLIGIDKLLDTVIGLVHTDGCITLNGDGTALQVHLF